MPSKISDEHLDHYRRHGYAVIEDFLDTEELAGARAEIETMFPGWLAYVDDPESNEAPKDEGLNVRVFPYAGNTINSISVSAEIRDFVSRVTGKDEIAITQSNLMLKQSGGWADADQDLHCDSIGQTLTYPSSDPAFWQVLFIMYYSDVAPDQAPTAVVSNEVVGDELRWPSIVKREDRPDLYEKERKIVPVRAGTLFAYSVRTFHRGTKFATPGARIVQFLSYAPADVRWVGIIGWPGRVAGEDWNRFVKNATPTELEMFGFPPPGHPFWTEETLAGVRARYPDMDLAPYVQASPA